MVERPEDRHLYLAVRYSNLEPIPSWLLSDGTLRLFALTLLAYLPHHQEIYLIEEVENGVHPRAIEAVFDSLSSVYDGQVLLATHSPLIVGLSKPEQVLCFAKNASGATSIVRGSEASKVKRLARTGGFRNTIRSGSFRMRTAEQERKDLIVLVADGHQEQTVATLLTRRQPSLGIRQIAIDIDSDIRPHPNRDPGVFHGAGSFLEVLAQHSTNMP